ncbi:MAG: hypothetical protein U1C74_17245 [Phenylobacterium sp.]|nr:hypothetical protein [Phenylobacterium sp.]
MPLYTIYPTRLDGLSDSFETAELAGDADVLTEALRVLDAHESAVSVVVYCDNRKVLTRFKIDPEMPQGLADAQMRAVFAAREPSSQSAG